MGLFDKKEPCAICGGKVSALFPWKIEGKLVCNECHGVVDLPDEMEKNITIEEFKVYMAYREENELLKKQFQTTRQVDFGWLDDKFLFDTEKRLLCMDKKLRKPVFEGKQIKSFEIKEDETPLFSGSAEGLTRYTSTVPERVMALEPQIDQLRMQIRMNREIERLREERKKIEGDNYVYESEPLTDVDIPVPFQKFYVEIEFEHPYYPSFATNRMAPRFSGSEPNVNDYLNEYNKDFKLMEELAMALMEVAFPGAPERTVASESTGTVERVVASSGGVSAPGVAVDTAEEIRRFKALMDEGIITEEEFAAKKRQLLGI